MPKSLPQQPPALPPPNKQQQVSQPVANQFREISVMYVYI